MRTLFRQNRVVSSISAELDQKSIFELFTDPTLAERLFTVEERQVMRRHVLWTRLLAARYTTSPTGERIDLLEYARRERESLVLKPNRSYGGEGVVVGHAADAGRVGIRARPRARRRASRWVLQQAAHDPREVVPRARRRRIRLHVEPFYVVMGFAPSRYGVAMMARASQQQVVNVAQHGGMCAVMVSASPLRKDGESLDERRVRHALDGQVAARSIGQPLRGTHGAPFAAPRRLATIAGRFWITITRDEGFDRTYTNVLPSGETSMFPCGFDVTIAAAGKSAFRDATASAGRVAIVAAIIIGSARDSVVGTSAVDQLPPVRAPHRLAPAADRHLDLLVVPFQAAHVHLFAAPTGWR